MSTEIRTNWKLLQSRISDISEDTKIEFSLNLTDSSTKTGFSFCKAHSNLTVRFGQHGNCMPLSGLVIVFMHDHHPPSPAMRQIAEWSRKSGFEKGKNTRWKETRYLHYCSKKTHSSIMNISFGLYMWEKEISSVLSPQKFIAASTSGIAFCCCCCCC